MWSETRPDCSDPRLNVYWTNGVLGVSITWLVAAAVALLLWAMNSFIKLNWCLVSVGVVRNTNTMRCDGCRSFGFYLTCLLGIFIPCPSVNIQYDLCCVKRCFVLLLVFLCCGCRGSDWLSISRLLMGVDTFVWGLYRRSRDKGRWTGSEKWFVGLFRRE